MTDDTPKPEAPAVAPPAATDAAPAAPAPAPEGELVAAEAVAEATAGIQAEAEAAAEVVAEAPAEDAAAEPADAPSAGAKTDLSPAATGARLAELFPALFAAPARPIKLRIQADIQARAPGAFTKKGLSLFLHRHTTSTAYLRSLVASPTRFDLDGQPAGDIAEEHREAAKLEVERRRAIVEAKRAAERDALRQRQREQAREQGREPGRGAPRERAPQAEGAAPDVPPQRRPERRPDRPPRAPRPDHAPREARAERPADHAPAPVAEPPVRDADFEARRDRAALLRAYETSTITRANFCVLKRISEAELDATLAIARKEREDRPPMPPRHDGAPRPQGRPPQGDRRPGARPEGRGPRPPGKGRPRETAPR